MHFSKYLKRTILPVAVAASMLLPTTSQIAYAAETPEITIDESFVPSRSYIPYYLSQNSSIKSEMIKKLWEKVFYEELNWKPGYNFYDKKYSSWVDKYHNNYSTRGKGMKDLKSQLNGSTITYAAGDFDAYFANTLVANPEFLGELIGLPGYESVPEAGRELMKQVMYTRLSNPGKYTYLAEGILCLTADGTYIGESRTAGSNLLKTASMDGTSFDILVLANLVQFYKGTEVEPYLSVNQVTWIKSYTEYLYMDYVANRDSSIAKRYAPIYDLIARSSYAANGTLRQEFFNYVEKSGKGAGQWLNLIDNVNIEGLDSVNSIETLFKLSEGYCNGHEASFLCRDRNLCLAGTTIDEMAWTLYFTSKSNNTIYSLFSGNPKVNIAINGTEGWLAHYTYNHSSALADSDYEIEVMSLGDVTGSKKDEGDFTNYNSRMLNATVQKTMTIPAAALKSNADFIAVHPNNVGKMKLDGSNSGHQGNGAYANRITKYTVVVKNGDNAETMTDHVPYEWDEDKEGYKIDLTNLSWTMRQNATISITFKSYNSYKVNVMSSSSEHHKVEANVSINGNIDIYKKKVNCKMNGHQWKGEVTSWSKDFSTAVITYQCRRDSSHTTSETVDVTKTDSGDTITYTAKGLYDTYSTQRNKETKEATKTIAISNAIASGTFENSAQDNQWIFPAGSKSESSYKEARTTLNFQINSGVIKPGAKKIELKLSKVQKLDSLTFTIYSKTGKVLARNNATISQTTCYLNGYSDKDLEGCYALVTARALHRNTEAGVFTEPAKATVHIKAESITVHY